MSSIELPDDLVRQVKDRAAREGRRVADLVAELLRAGLRTKAASGATNTAKSALPIIDCDPAKPGEEITPERVADILWGSAQ
jgi:plasmid stability protein